MWIRIILVLGLTLLVLQTVESKPPMQAAPAAAAPASPAPAEAPESYPSPWTPQSFERLGLVGSLMVAVVVLWKALQQSNSLIMDALKSETAALQAAATSNAELRRVIEDSAATKEQFIEALNLLRAAQNQFYAADPDGRQSFAAVSPLKLKP